MPVGAAIVGGAVISSQASSRASSEASRAARGAAAGITQASEEARRDVLDIFPLAQRDLLAGASGAFDIFSQGLGGQQSLLSQGNLNAQQTLAQGLPQVQAALLGVAPPVGSMAFAPQGVDIPQGFDNPFGGTGGVGGLGSGVTALAQGQTPTFTQNPFGAALNAAGLLIPDPNSPSGTTIDFGAASSGNFNPVLPENVVNRRTETPLGELAFSLLGR